MRIEYNIPLSKYTTFKMGGIAKKFYLPESEDEIYALVIEKKLPRYLIGGGSNLLINDQREFEEVISLRNFNTEIKNLGDGKFYVGASVQLQRLIKTVNDAGYGGIEYLQSVPGLVGGAIVMNAGRGNSKDEIGKYVLSVRAIVDGEIQELQHNDCKFARRTSVFKNSDIVVVGVLMQFEVGNSEEFSRLREERVKYVKDMQDNSHPNFGTVFFKSDWKLMKLVRKLSKEKKGVYYSMKTNNWLLNNSGTFNEAIQQIEKVKKLHRRFRRPCETEVIIWK